MGEFCQFELPGEDLILKGIKDLMNDLDSVESLLVSIGAPRLRKLNLHIPEYKYADFPEQRLYRLLKSQDPDTAHSRMNAYIRRLVSFERSLENSRS